MTELKKNNKRSINEPNSKTNVKKLKKTAAPDKTKKAFKDGPKKFEKKKFGKFDHKGGKFDRKGGKPQPHAPTEKTNWNELKQKKKDLKIQRRKNKSQELYDIDVKAKKIYEELKM